MKKTLFRISSVVLCFVFLFSATTSPVLARNSPYKPRHTVNFNDMVYSRPDVEKLSASFVALTESLRKTEEFSSVLNIEAAYNRQAESFDTAYALASIRHDQNREDEFFVEEMRFLEEAAVELSLLHNAFARLLVEGPFAEEYRAHVGDYVFLAIERDASLALSDVADLVQAREALRSRYQEHFTTLSITDNGSTFTLSDINALASYAQIERLQSLYYARYGDVYAALLAELIALDEEISEILGFSDVPSMYYQSYGRDYSPEQALAVCEDLRQHFSPLLAQFSFSTPNEDLSLERIMQTLPDSLERLDVRFLDAWQFMLEYSLYDIADRSQKPSYAYTTYLANYDAPFLFGKYTDDSFSFSALVHEFGHFTDFFTHYDDEFVYNLDISETFASGLEMLLLQEYDSLFANPAQMQAQQLQNTAYTMVHQAALEAFQLELYQQEHFDADSIGLLYAEVLADYGLNALLTLNNEGADGDWMGILHLFEVPFYTVSYVASTSAALQVFALSLQDETAATDAYLTLLQANQNQAYTAFLQTAGLLPLTDESLFYELSHLYREYFALPILEDSAA